MRPEIRELSGTWTGFDGIFCEQRERGRDFSGTWIHTCDDGRQRERVSRTAKE